MKHTGPPCLIGLVLATAVSASAHGTNAVMGRDNRLVPATSHCGKPATPIASIQGAATISPLAGQVHTIEAIVVGAFQGKDALQGFFVQEEDADQDGDPGTSEGLFVFDGALPATAVSAGDQVRATGTVTEFEGLTELAEISQLSVCDSNRSVTPAQPIFPLSSTDGLERYEGMAVYFDQTLTVSGVFNLVRFGEVLLSNGRLMIPTQVVAPGSDAQAQDHLNQRNQIILDDLRNGAYQRPFAYDFRADNGLRNGSSIRGLTGVVDEAFGAYRIRPTRRVVFNPTNARQISPPQATAGLRVASFNVLNYFTTLNQSGNTCGPANEGCRGASSVSELRRQQDKLVAALSAINADIVGLVELENNPNASLSTLTDALNTTLGGRTYAFVDSGTIGQDVIKVGLIYKPARVAPVGHHAVLDSTVDTRFDSRLNRPALAQTFRHRAEQFMIVINHLKSKSCRDASGSQADQNDGQGCYNAARTAAARALADWLATDPTGSGDSDILVLGDLNAYAQEAPIAVLKQTGLVDLTSRFLGAQSYSFVFFGQAGSLDHALASPALALRVSSVAHWRINADESPLLDYREGRLPAGGPPKPPAFYRANAVRSSDHDPLIITINVVKPPPKPVGSDKFNRSRPPD